jgi:cytochrome c biogenesis protein CcdA
MLHTNKDQKSPAKRFLFIFGLLIFVCYLILGVGLIVNKQLLPQIENPYRWIFAMLLIVYAGFRFIRLLQTRD